MTDLTIPRDLLPADGRFGCGPSKVRPEAVAALAAAGTDYLGTSHRQATVLFEVGALRNHVSELFQPPRRLRGAPRQRRLDAVLGRCAWA